MRIRVSIFLISLIAVVETATAQLQTAENGLSRSGLDAVHLGGSLIKNTFINTNLNNFHFDNASGPILSILNNGNIGIGTYTPTARLSFPNAGASEEGSGINWGSNNSIYEYGIHRTPGAWQYPNYQQLRLGWLTGIILDPGVNFVKSYVDVQGKGLRVSSGSIGIGTANTGDYAMSIENFNYEGSGSFIAPKVSIKNTSTTLPAGNTNNIAGIDYSAGNAQVFGQIYANYGVGTYAPFNNGSGFYIATKTEHPIVFVTGSAISEKARITASGNLLLGTTTDNAMRLQVNGYGCFTGPVGTGSGVFWGDNVTNRAMGINSYGDADGSSRYTAIGHNMWEAGSKYATAKPGGGIYLDDRSGNLPIRFMYKKAGEDPSSQAGGVSEFGNFIFGSTNSDNGSKLQVTGNTSLIGATGSAGPVLIMGDVVRPNAFAIRSFGDNTGTDRFTAIGHNMPEAGYIYATDKQGGGLYLDDRSYIMPIRFLVKQAGLSVSTQAGGVSANGNFILGTANSDNGNKLQINGSVWAGGLILPNGAGAGKVLTSDANGNATWQTATGSGTAGWSLTGNNDANAKLGTIGSIDLPIITGNVEQMRIGANGNVGIGTTAISGNYKLSVEGTIRTRKVRVDAATWADYVFESDYKLRPLKEVEQFIQQEKHLPEVPTAAEVKKEGLDIGDNQAILLKKIEELTLYVIQQQKQLEAQQQKIETLEKKVNEKK